MAADKLRGFEGRVEGVGKTVLLASFGIDHNDEHAVAATHGALVVRRAAAEMARMLGTAPLRVGVHSVEVPVRIGAGAPVIDADASRLAWNSVESAMASAEAGTIVATAPAAALIRRRFAIAPIDQAGGALRSRASGATTRPPGASGSSSRGDRRSSPCSRADSPRRPQGRGQVVDIAGEAGIGKSRLVLELVASRSLEGADYFEGRCLPTEVATPFAPLLQIAAAVCGIAERDSAETIEKKVSLALGGSGPDADDSAAALVYLLGAKTTPPESPSGALKKRLFAAVLRLLLARSARSPLLILVEDIHWIDPTSEACLAAIVEATSRASILPGHDVSHGLPAALGGHRLKPPAHTGAPVDRREPRRHPPSGRRKLAHRRPGAKDPKLGGGQSPLPRRVEPCRTRTGRRLTGAADPCHDRGHDRCQIRAAVGAASPGAHRRGRGWARRSAGALAGGCRVGRGGCGRRRRRPRAGRFPLRVGAGDLESGATLSGTPSFRKRPMRSFRRRSAERSTCEWSTRSKLYPDQRTNHVEKLAHHAAQGGAAERAIRYLLEAGRKAVTRFALAEATSQLGGGRRLPKASVRSRTGSMGTGAVGGDRHGVHRRERSGVGGGGSRVLPRRRASRSGPGLSAAPALC